MPALLSFVASLLLTCSCDYAAKWRDAQVAESHSLAQGDRITPPVSQPADAKELAKDLPVEPAWPVLEYAENGDSVKVKLLSTREADQTTVLVDQRLREMGYDSGDNISRLLEGVTYQGGQGKYTKIFAKVSVNSTNQATVELHATR